MKLDEVLRIRAKPPIAPVLPSTEAVDAAIRKVIKTWPDIAPEENEKNHEIIIENFVNYIRMGDWNDIKMSEVITAFRIAFLEKYNARTDVNEIREFAFNELEATTKETLVNSFLKIYSENFSEVSEISKTLSSVLMEIF